MASARIIYDDDTQNVANQAVTPTASSLPKIRIVNKRTGEVKFIDPSEAQNFGLNPTEALSRVEAMNKLQQLEKGGEVDPEKVAKNKEVGSVIDNVIDRFNTINEASLGPFAGSFAKIVPGVSAETRQYEKLRSGVAGVLKDLVGETGVLTDQDITRITNLLPDPGATLDEIELSKQDLANFLESKGITSSTLTSGQVENNEAKPPSEEESIGFKTGLGLEGVTYSPLSPEHEVAQQAVQEEFKGNPLFGKSVLGAALSGRFDAIPELVEQRAEYFNDKYSTPEGQQELAGGFGPVTQATKSIVGSAKDSIGNVVGSATGSTIKKAGEARMAVAKALEDSGVTIQNEDLSKIAGDMVEKNIASYIEQPLVQKLANGEGISPVDAVELMSRAGKKTFTKGGDYRTNKAADYYDLLRDAIRQEFERVGPQVLEETTNLAKAQKNREFLKRMVFPTAVGTGISAGVGIPLTLALNRALGQER